MAHQRIRGKPLPSIGLLAGLLLLAACITQGRPVTGTAAEIAASDPADGLGRIYFYRQEDAFMAAVEPGIIVNGKWVGTARYGEVFFRDALPGRYEVFSTHNDDGTVTFTLAEGERVYIKTVPRLDGRTTELTAIKVAPATAAAEIQPLALVQGDEPPPQ